MKLLQTIRLDDSDTFLFETAAAPGAFAFAHLDPARLEGKARAAFRGGFLGIGSLGWSTLVRIVEVNPEDRTAAVAALATQLVARFGAPDLATALPAAEEEIDFAASLADHPAGMLATVSRSYEAAAIRETFRALRSSVERAVPRLRRPERDRRGIRSAPGSHRPCGDVDGKGAGERRTCGAGGRDYGARAHPCGRGGRAARGEESVARLSVAADIGAGWRLLGGAMDADQRGGRDRLVLCGRGCYRAIPDRDRKLPRQSRLGRSPSVGGLASHGVGARLRASRRDRRSGGGRGIHGRRQRSGRDGADAGHHRRRQSAISSPSITWSGRSSSAAAGQSSCIRQPGAKASRRAGNDGVGKLRRALVAVEARIGDERRDHSRRERVARHGRARGLRSCDPAAGRVDHV